MFFELAQFSKFFIIAPLTWIAASLIATFLVKRRWLKISLFSLFAFLFIFFTNPYILTKVKYNLSQSLPQTNINPQKTYDVAIVLGGFSSINKHTGGLTFINDRADRLWEAVRLHKEGKVKKILITGDPATKINDNGSSTASQFLDYMETFGVPRDVFILEQHALNTKENALFSLQLLDKEFSHPSPPSPQSSPITGGVRGGPEASSPSPHGEGRGEAILITSAIHMGRALDSFHNVGLYPDYYSVSIPNPPSDITFRSFYPSWEAATDWQEILNEYVGSIIYKITD